MKPVVIGIAGGSGSGKTSVVQEIIKMSGTTRILCISHDAYYHDLEHLPEEERSNHNFDHPDALDTGLLVQHLHALQAGRSVKLPIYDFSTHTRKKETKSVSPSPVILVEGMLILWEEQLRSMFDLKLFVHTSDDLRIIRRIQRDTVDRGRSVQSVIKQYLSSVRPMHQEFVEPSKQYADLIIPYDQHNPAAIDLISRKLHPFPLESG